MSSFGNIDFFGFFVGFYVGGKVDGVVLDIVGKFFDVYDVCNYWFGMYVDMGFKVGMFFGFLLYFQACYEFLNFYSSQGYVYGFIFICVLYVVYGEVGIVYGFDFFQVVFFYDFIKGVEVVVNFGDQVFWFYVF